MSGDPSGWTAHVAAASPNHRHVSAPKNWRMRANLSSRYRGNKFSMDLSNVFIALLLFICVLLWRRVVSRQVGARVIIEMLGGTFRILIF